MTPIDPISLMGAGGQDRVLAVQRVMEAMQQPMAEALPSTPLQNLQQTAPISVQYAQATVDVFTRVADNSVLRQRETGRALAPDQSVEFAHLQARAPAVRTDATALSLAPGRWMAALDPRQEASRDAGADVQEEGDGCQHKVTEPGPAHDEESWRSEAPALSFSQLCRVMRAQGQAAVLARLAQGRCALAVLHTGSAGSVCMWAALMCPSVEFGTHGSQSLHGELKLFRVRLVASQLPSLWRVRQHVGTAASDWRLLSDSGAPALWLDEQAPADAPGLHIAHGQRMRLDLAKQWVMWVVNLKGDANQWEH